MTSSTMTLAPASRSARMLFAKLACHPGRWRTPGRRPARRRGRSEASPGPRRCREPQPKSVSSCITVDACREVAGGHVALAPPPRQLKLSDRTPTLTPSRPDRRASRATSARSDMIALAGHLTRRCVMASAWRANRREATPSSDGIAAMGRRAETRRPAMAVLLAPRAMSSASSAARIARRDGVDRHPVAGDAGGSAESTGTSARRWRSARHRHPSPHIAATEKLLAPRGL